MLVSTPCRGSRRPRRFARRLYPTRSAGFPDSVLLRQIAAAVEVGHGIAGQPRGGRYLFGELDAAPANSAVAWALMFRA